MRSVTRIAAIALFLAVAVRPGLCADNVLTEKEKAEGWELMFDPSDPNNKDMWRISSDLNKPIRWNVEEDSLVPFKCGGYLAIYNKKYSDFIFKCDVRMGNKDTDRCNSGIFFRVGNTKDPVQNGLEMQVATGKSPNTHSFGAIYDAAKPTKNATNGANKWDHVQITCKGPHITIEVNGEEVLKMNCADYTEKNKNPDGTKNKYNKPINDFPREGYFGVQDHFDGTKAYYKNMKVLPLDKK